MKSQIIEQIKAFHHAEPFRPFRLVLDDGRRIDIERPEFLGRFPKNDRIFYSTEEDTTAVLEVARIARVELKPTDAERGRRRAG